MGDRNADAAVYLSFIARVCFGFAISLLTVTLVLTALGTCNARAYSLRAILLYLIIIVRTC